MHVNYEFKASCENLPLLEAKLITQNPRFAGTDHQTDTYFNVPYGRLKLREGNIEHALIHYNRSDLAGSKQSNVLLYQPSPASGLKEILTAALGIKIVVDKKRKIYFLDNVKFHFDEVKGLGNFVEVEAIDADGSIGMQRLKDQCDHFARLFNIGPDEFQTGSYSDMLGGMAF